MESLIIARSRHFGHWTGMLIDAHIVKKSCCASPLPGNLDGKNGLYSGHHIGTGGGTATIGFTGVYAQTASNTANAE